MYFNWDELERMTGEFNRTPQEDFDGFTPEEMHAILYDPFGASCPIHINTSIDVQWLETSPMYNLIRHLLDLLRQEGELSLTKIGNLRRNVVRELYKEQYLPQEDIESGITKLSSENDWKALRSAKLALEFSGIVRKYREKLVPVKKRDSLLDPENSVDMFIRFFRVFTTEFNWAYNDRYPSETAGQEGFLYLLYLLRNYGKTERDLSFYSGRYFQAFPDLQIPERDQYGPYSKSEQVIRTRFFRRFTEWFGFSTMRRTGEAEHYLLQRIKIKHTAFLRELIHLRNS
ncbi:MAG: hypothetical protein K9N46_09145 [Candidatus Marinimicrobia bacterium]|nr:hypothetical protein [Candidatus Neomarinimicrobiota bacterium]MCF7829405.1 hypothetical protein [Candidatus Neomarinimicrobiota bacterium]MCF7880891.1 hypothetical protein [Candidatus Neomarinimicrobiota bacterium]